MIAAPWFTSAWWIAELIVIQAAELALPIK